eukprot:SAG22_NODE_61_length_23387_cov_34.380582_11_plen_419_part_00
MQRKRATPAPNTAAAAAAPPPHLHPHSTVLVRDHFLNEQLAAENSELKRRLDAYERNQHLKFENERLRAALAAHGDPDHTVGRHDAAEAESTAGHGHDHGHSAGRAGREQAGDGTDGMQQGEAQHAQAPRQGEPQQGQSHGQQPGGGANFSATIGHMPAGGGAAAVLASVRPSEPDELRALMEMVGLVAPKVLRPQVAPATALVCVTLSLLQLELAGANGRPQYAKAQALQRVLEESYGGGSDLSWGGVRVAKLRAAVDSTTGLLRVAMLVEGLPQGGGGGGESEPGDGGSARGRQLWAAARLAMAAAPETHLGFELSKTPVHLMEGKDTVAAMLGCRLTAAATLAGIPIGGLPLPAAGGGTWQRAAALRAVGAGLLGGLNVGLTFRPLGGTDSCPTSQPARLPQFSHQLLALDLLKT